MFQGYMGDQSLALCVECASFQCGGAIDDVRVSGGETYDAAPIARCIARRMPWRAPGAQPTLHVISVCGLRLVGYGGDRCDPTPWAPCAQQRLLFAVVAGHFCGGI